MGKSQDLFGQNQNFAFLKKPSSYNYGVESYHMNYGVLFISYRLLQHDHYVYFGLT